MLKRRAGDEKPLEELGTRYMSNRSYASRSPDLFVTLREELAVCESKTALRKAIELWEI